MDRPSFWICWGIVALVMTFILGMIIGNFGIAFIISAAIIVVIWVIWFLADKAKDNSVGSGVSSGSAVKPQQVSPTSKQADEIDMQAFKGNENAGQKKGCPEKNSPARVIGPRKDAAEDAKNFGNAELADSLEDFVEVMRNQYNVFTSDPNPVTNVQAYEAFFENSVWLMEYSAEFADRLSDDFLSADTRCEDDDWYLLAEDEMEDISNSVLKDWILHAVEEMRKQYYDVFYGEYDEKASDDFLLNATLLVDYDFELLRRLKVWSASCGTDDDEDGDDIDDEVESYDEENDTDIEDEEEIGKIDVSDFERRE